MKLESVRNVFACWNSIHKRSSGIIVIFLLSINPSRKSANWLSLDAYCCDSIIHWIFAPFAARSWKSLLASVSVKLYNQNCRLFGVHKNWYRCCHSSRYGPIAILPSMSCNVHSANHRAVSSFVLEDDCGVCCIVNTSKYFAATISKITTRIATPTCTRFVFFILQLYATCTWLQRKS